MSKPKAYRLGNTVWTLMLGSTDVYSCDDIDIGGCHLNNEELELMGAVPVDCTCTTTPEGLHSMCKSCSPCREQVD